MHQQTFSRGIAAAVHGNRVSCSEVGSRRYQIAGLVQRVSTKEGSTRCVDCQLCRLTGISCGLAKEVACRIELLGDLCTGIQ